MNNQFYRYNWPGDVILGAPKVSDRRWIQSPRSAQRGQARNIPVAHDLRSWITSPNNWEIRRVLPILALRGMPSGTAPGSMDARVYYCWQFVAENISYLDERLLPRVKGVTDIWQFPAETLATGSGDCEDCSFLLASLMIASGISEDKIRVVIGQLIRIGQPSQAHAWIIYLDEREIWRVIESTSQPVEITRAPTADSAAQPGNPNRYSPILCFNRQEARALTPEVIEWAHTLYQDL